MRDNFLDDIGEVDQLDPILSDTNPLSSSHLLIPVVGSYPATPQMTSPAQPPKLALIKIRDSNAIESLVKSGFKDFFEETKVLWILPEEKTTNRESTFKKQARNIVICKAKLDPEESSSNILEYAMNKVTTEFSPEKMPTEQHVYEKIGGRRSKEASIIACKFILNMFFWSKLPLPFAVCQFLGRLEWLQENCKRRDYLVYKGSKAHLRSPSCQYDNELKFIDSPEDIGKKYLDYRAPPSPLVARSQSVSLSLPPQSPLLSPLGPGLPPDSPFLPVVPAAVIPATTSLLLPGSSVIPEEKEKEKETIGQLKLKRKTMETSINEMLQIVKKQNQILQQWSQLRAVQSSSASVSGSNPPAFR